MMNAILGTKEYMTQIFDNESKHVIPVTVVNVKNCVVCGVKTIEKNGYSAVVLGLGKKGKVSKAEEGEYKELGYVPRFIREIRVDDVEGVKVGDKVSGEAFELNQVLDIEGTSKGKGFQGVVKRYGFAGGPKTHGQSDRWRAPGSIGMRSTPGRVFKGKKMPGRMGVDKVTVFATLVKNDTKNGLLLVKGSVPGGRNSLLVLKERTR